MGIEWTTEYIDDEKQESASQVEGSITRIVQTWNAYLVFRVIALRIDTASRKAGLLKPYRPWLGSMESIVVA